MSFRFISIAALFCPVPLGVYLRSNPLQTLLSSEYSPRRALYLSHPGLLWTNVISDGLIAIAYALFFFGILWLIRKLKHLEFMKLNLWVLAAFNVFIVSCGAMILLRIITIWYPLVQISLGLKIICAAASLPTAIIFAWRASAIASGICRFFDLLAAEHTRANALRHSEALLDRTNRIARIGGWEIDLLTNKVTWSAETARIHGLPPGYQPTLEEGINFFAPESRYTVRSRIEKGMAGGPPWEDELQLLRPDGSRVWVRVLGEVEFQNGKAVRLFGSMQDKTQEFTQRTALRRSELLLDQTNHVAGIGGWELDLLTGVIVWSNETARIHGLKPGYQPNLEEAIGFFAPEDQPKLTSALDSAMRVGGSWDFELTLIRTDGRHVWVRLLGETEFVDGKPVRLFGSVQDKTVDFEQREALRKSEYLLDRANRVAGMGGWEVDLTTNEVTWSAETARIHGLPPGYKPTLEEGINYFAPESRPAIDAMLHKAITQGVGWDVELILLRVDGQRRLVRHLGDVEFVNGKALKLFGSLQDKTEEIEQREALRKSQNFLDRTNRIAGVGGWEVDIATGIVTWSAETYRLHGLPQTYQPTLAAGLSFYSPNDQPIVTAAVQHALKTGEGWDLESEFVRADDKHIWVRTVGNVELVDGKPTRLIGAIQDKTAQISARLALTRANERITLATDSGGIGIWDWDIVLNKFICDAWMFRLHGLEPTGDPTPITFWTEHLHPDDRPLVVSALMDALEDRKPYDMEFRVLWDDATTHIIKATGQVIRDASGRPVRMIGTNRDVTEARRLAAELEQQHELLRVTLLSIGDAVISKDVHRNIVWMNGAAERMTGWSAADAIGKPVAEIFNLVYDASRRTAEAHVNPDIASIRRISMDERVLLISRDNVERNIETCATPIYNAQGNLIGSVLVVRDVTEQFRLARETEQITKLQMDLKLKDEFLSHVSHELRSPLPSVYSFTSIIADNLAGDTTDEQQQYLQIVLKNVLQLQAMIEDLLTVTQSKEGKLPIEAQDVPVASAILDAVNISHPAATAKDISITSMDTSELPNVHTDPTRLCQIMIILLDNAIKFTPDGGHIDIRVVEDGSMLRFEVEDNGCGIPLEKRARIFEKLYQIIGPDHADTSLQGRIGLGLGLHIARDLVRRQGGHIWVTGAPEQGSIFNFTVPIASEKIDADSTPRRRKTDWPEHAPRELTSAA